MPTNHKTNVPMPHGNEWSLGNAWRNQGFAAWCCWLHEAALARTGFTAAHTLCWLCCTGCAVLAALHASTYPPPDEMNLGVEGAVGQPFSRQCTAQRANALNACWLRAAR
jgi:hypothetical protein